MPSAGWTRASRTGFALITLVGFAACHGGSRPAATDPLVELTGFLNVMVGDPAPPGGAPQLRISLSLENGRTVALMADSTRTTALSEASRLRGRVRATGHYIGGDTTALWIERVDSIVPGAGG